jgi:hypothetical protein
MNFFSLSNESSKNKGKNAYNDDYILYFIKRIGSIVVLNKGVLLVGMEISRYSVSRAGAIRAVIGMNCEHTGINVFRSYSMLAHASSCNSIVVYEPRFLVVVRKERGRLFSSANPSKDEISFLTNFLEDVRKDPVCKIQSEEGFPSTNREESQMNVFDYLLKNSMK